MPHQPPWYHTHCKSIGTAFSTSTILKRTFESFNNFSHKGGQFLGKGTRSTSHLAYKITHHAGNNLHGPAGVEGAEVPDIVFTTWINIS